MLSMMGGTGMGSAGLGAGSTPMVPGGGMTPQMMAMLMQMQGNGSGQPVAPAPGPMQAPPTGTPMAGYLGSGGNPGAIHPMQVPPVAQPPGMNAAAPAANPMGGISPQMLQLMQQLKGQQSGVAATPGALSAAQNPNASGMGWLQQLLGGGGTGAVAPAGGVT